MRTPQRILALLGVPTLVITFMSQKFPKQALYAAIDLGSNSYRLEISCFEHGQRRRIEYLKETVRQGSGLDDELRLTPAAMQRGWDCLARFAERLRGFDSACVRAVATQTLREARNCQEFIARAQTILGFPIDVIAGREEARLIYLGVAHALPPSNERRMVVDIGGRSTEIILGQGAEPTTTESFALGSVSWSARFFPDGKFTAGAFGRAEIAAKAVLEEGLQAFEASRWDSVYGASGTVGAVADILCANQWSTGEITQANLDWLLERLLKSQSADQLKLMGLKDDRKPVIAGGVSILRALFDLLGIERMQVTDGGLRHGVLYELLNLPAVSDQRERTVTRLCEKFGVDLAQGKRVVNAATTLFDKLNVGESEADIGRIESLRWAAQLHELGWSISHSEHHKHGAYILGNADAPGFSQQQLQGLSRLVLGQRGKLKKLEAYLGDAMFLRQLLALRLAVILCHARQTPQVDVLSLRIHSGARPRFSLSAPRGWADAFPQSAHLLREEAQAWVKAPCPLELTGL